MKKRITFFVFICLALMMLPFAACAEPAPAPAPIVIQPTPAVVTPAPAVAAPAAPAVVPAAVPGPAAAPAAPPVTPAPAAPVVVTAAPAAPVFTVMDPRSYVQPVDYVGLSAPRLTTLDGAKVLCVNTHGGNEDAPKSIAPALQAAYPNCIVTHHEGSGMWRFEKDEEAWMIENFDAVIIAENY